MKELQGWWRWLRGNIYCLPGHTLWYCKHCCGWGNEPSGAACYLCGGRGWE